MTGQDGAAVPARLRWRCRRGTRELDTLFGRWLEAGWAESGAKAQSLFDRLLDESDPDLWDWLIGQASPPGEYAELVHAIRARSGL